MKSHDLMIPVTALEEIDGDNALAVTVHLPDAIGPRVRVYFGFPGGGYGRRYFDIATKPGYSQAEFHTARGAIFVAIDHLGVGDSTNPDPFSLTYENLAEANHQASIAVLDGLRNGTLLAGVGPIDVAQTVAMGQSMGGCLLTVQQAPHSTFDAVAFLGWSGVFTNFPAPDGSRIVYPMPPRGFDVRAIADQLTSSSPDLDHYRFCFHWPDEDPDLMEPDLASYKPYTGLVRGDASTPWGSDTVPPCAVTMMTQGSVAPEAAAITVPVLAAMGEVDVVADPNAERSAYTSSAEVSVVVISHMAHMHNFARSRQQLWDYIEVFARPR